MLKLHNWIDDKKIKWDYLARNPNAISLLEQYIIKNYEHLIFLEKKI